MCVDRRGLVPSKDTKRELIVHSRRPALSSITHSVAHMHGPTPIYTCYTPHHLCFLMGEALLIYQPLLSVGLPHGFIA